MVKNTTRQGKSWKFSKQDAYTANGALFDEETASIMHALFIYICIIVWNWDYTLIPRASHETVKGFVN